MNTTTITINWVDYEGYIAAIRSISKSTMNTFTEKCETYEIDAFSSRVKYSPEKQREVMEFFGCISDRSKRKRFEPLLKCQIRFLIWRYCWTKFDVTTSELAKITGHNRSSVTTGIKKIDELLKYDDIKQLKSEVYAKCNEIFI